MLLCVSLIDVANQHEIELNFAVAAAPRYIQLVRSHSLRIRTRA